MIIVDGHLDLAQNALALNRNLLYSAHTIRLQEISTPGKGRTQGMVAIPEMRRGRIALSFVTLVARSSGHPAPYIDYGSLAQAYGMAHGHLFFYRGLERQGYARILTHRAGLDAHMAEWEAWDAGHPDETVETPPLGMILLMESADPIIEPEHLEEWVDAGLRMIGLCHFGYGRYAGGNGTEVGLTELGSRLLREMERLGVLLDLTHCSDQSFWEALGHYNGRVLATHCNARALVPNQRHFTDEQIRAILERDGVIGINLGCSDLVAGWIIGHSSNRNVTLYHAVDHMDHICQLAGDSRHVAIGSDMDGGVGADEFPIDLGTCDRLQRFQDVLAERQYKDEDIHNILRDNWLRLLREVW